MAQNLHYLGGNLRALAQTVFHLPSLQNTIQEPGNKAVSCAHRIDHGRCRENAEGRERSSVVSKASLVTEGSHRDLHATIHLVFQKALNEGIPLLVVGIETVIHKGKGALRQRMIKSVGVVKADSLTPHGLDSGQHLVG